MMIVCSFAITTIFNISTPTIFGDIFVKRAPTILLFFYNATLMTSLEKDIQNKPLAFFLLQSNKKIKIGNSN